MMCVFSSAQSSSSSNNPAAKPDFADGLVPAVISTQIPKRASGTFRAAPTTPQNSKASGSVGFQSPAYEPYPPDDASDDEYTNVASYMLNDSDDDLGHGYGSDNQDSTDSSDSGRDV